METRNQSTNGYGAFHIQDGLNTDISSPTQNLNFSTRQRLGKNTSLRNFVWVVVAVVVVTILVMSKQEALVTFGDVAEGTIRSKNGLYLGAFDSSSWKTSNVYSTAKQEPATFYVSLKLRDSDDLRDELLSISNPESESYGKHLSIETINHKYGPSVEQQTVVMEYFRGIHGSVVESNLHGDMIRVQ
eukprot:gene10212-21288_t